MSSTSKRKCFSLQLFPQKKKKQNKKKKKDQAEDYVDVSTLLSSLFISIQRLFFYFGTCAGDDDENISENLKNDRGLDPLDGLAL